MGKSPQQQYKCLGNKKATCPLLFKATSPSIFEYTAVSSSTSLEKYSSSTEDLVKSGPSQKDTAKPMRQISNAPKENFGKRPVSESKVTTSAHTRCAEVLTLSSRSMATPLSYAETAGKSTIWTGGPSITSPQKTVTSMSASFAA